MPELSASEYMILAATIEYVETLVPQFDAYRVFYNRSSDLNGARRFLLDRLQNQESVIYLAARRDNGRGLGFVQLYPSFSSFSMRNIWVLSDLFVIPSARQHGIARGLIEYAVQLAGDTGASGLRLAAAVDNLAALKLFESLGWSREEGFYHYYLKV